MTNDIIISPNSTVEDFCNLGMHFIFVAERRDSNNNLFFLHNRIDNDAQELINAAIEARKFAYVYVASTFYFYFLLMLNLILLFTKFPIALFQTI